MESNFIKSITQTIQGRSIFLIGMMASGKSETGPELAKRLSYKFVDLDSCIEAISKKTINNIFIEEGEEQFRKLENSCLKEMIKIPSMVVSTGGGVVLIPENWGILRQGIVIWIDLNTEIALERLRQQKEKRPLLKGKNLNKVYSDIYQSRKALYSQADIRVSINEENVEHVVDKILTELKHKIV